MATLSDLALRILISAKDDTAPGLNTARERIKSISDQLQQVEVLAKRFLNVTLFTGWGQDAIRLADSYKTLQARLQLVSDSAQEFSRAQSELFGVAQRTRSSLEATYGVYGKLETVIKQLGGTQQQAIATTETLNQAIALTSQGAAQDAAAILQFSQALGSGVLRGDEFNSVMENSLGLAQAFADGLGVPINKLREMAEAGQLTADRLVNALGNSAPKVAEQFAKLPVTVSGAMQQLNNAMLQFVGQSNTASVSVSVISGALQGLAKNFNQVADAATIIATLLLGRSLQGWLQSAAAARESAVASREKALADETARQAAQRALVTEAQVAALRVKTIAATVEEARLYAAIVAGTEKETAAKKALTVAISQLHTAQEQAAASSAKVNAGMADNGKKAGIMATGIRLLGEAFNRLFAALAAWDIGKMAGNWLNQFEAVRKAGTYLAESLVLIQTGIQGMLNGVSLSERWQQIKQIHAEFEQIRANDTTSAQTSAEAIAQTEQQKAQAAEQAALQQQAAFKQVQEATKALTAQLDADAKAQTAALQQGLTDKLAVIEISNQLDSIRDQQKLAAQLQAAQAETAIVQQTAAQKLALIDAEYQKELQAAANNAQRTKEIETEKRQAKLSVYQGLAEYYQSEVSRLSQVYAQENQAAQQSRNGLKTLEANYQKELFDLNLKGKTDRQILQTQEAEFRRKIQEAQQEYDKGEAADKEKLNRALNRAKELHGEITNAAGTGSTAIFEARGRMQKIFTLEKSVLQDNVKAHEGNAKGAKQAVDDAATNLKTVRDSITDIAEKLNRDYALKIGIDQASLSAAQQTIADLTKPETKLITIQTQDAAAQATGGLAGQPTGQPWRFAVGGFARKQGKLAGYGGGDKIQALLEPGEFIVRKEAVQKLGVPVLQAVNQGVLPLQRRWGGTIGDAVNEAIKKDKLEAIKQALVAAQSASAFEAIRGRSSLFANRAKEKALSGIDMSGLDAETAAQVRQAMASVPEAKKLKANRFTTLDFTGFLNKRNEQIREQSKQEGYAFKAMLDNLGKVSSKTLGDGGFKIPSMPNLPKLETAATMAPPSKTIALQFKAPNGAGQVEAAFNSETDVNKMLDILKQSGARVGAF